MSSLDAARAIGTSGARSIANAARRRLGSGTVPGENAAMASERAQPASGLLLTLGICFIASMCEGMDVQAAGVAAAGISHALRPTPGQLGVFFTAANAGLLVGAMVGGRLADRIGRKPVLTASLLAFGVCSLLTAGAWDMPTLTLARLATGLGLG